MKDVCLGFEVHQPLRLNRNFSEALVKGRTLAPDELFESYFNNAWNRGILRRVAEKCYYPANEVVMQNIDRHRDEGKKFKLAYSLSGVFLEQCEAWEKDLLDSFRQLSETGCAEFLEQTYYHSLASLYPDRGEFIEQVRMHRRAMKDLLGAEPRIFENTEFIYNNSVARCVEDLGYEGIFTEGAERVLGWRSPNHVYRAKDADIKVLLRNYRLSDDVAFRFSARWWREYPLTADKYASWLSSTPGQCINVFMDYETFGEHHWRESGIHEFLRWLPEEVLRHDNLRFSTPSEVVRRHRAVGELDVGDYETLSWADIERGVGAWLGNDMQRTCYNALRDMEPFVRESGNPKLLRLWRLLQTSDHLYYMFTAGGGPGIVHGYFSQQAPVEAFHAFTRILSDFQEKVAHSLPDPLKKSSMYLRLVPPDKAMHFYDDGEYTGISAHSLEELKDTVMLVPPGSISFHLTGDDLERWVRFVIGDKDLADRIKGMKGLKGEAAQAAIHEELVRRCTELRQSGDP